MTARSSHGVLAVAIMVGGGWAGYRVTQPAEDSFMSAEAVPEVEYLIGPQSFSSAESAKGMLTGLCERVRIKTATQVYKALRLPITSSERQRTLEAAIQELKREMHEFEGTDQGVELAQDLLVAMKAAGQLDGWIDTYLGLVYARPTHPVLVGLAERALTIGRAAGRDRDVVEALEHVSAIPVDFGGRDKILSCLAKAKAERAVARSDDPHAQSVGGLRE
jgi:hypothetical protein